MTKIRILIVDDDAEASRCLSSDLQGHNFDVHTVGSGKEAIRIFRVYDPSLVLMEVAMDGMSGLDTLERIKQINPDLPVIMISGQNNPELIFRASKLGADDFISKPFEPKELDLRIAKVLDEQRRGREARPPREQLRGQSDFALLLGTSPKMEEVKETIKQVADTNATVLIRGESGTGKEVVARMVCGQSLRRDKPFVKVNCAAIPYELLESELFGYEAGAFTGANRQKLGKFDLANHGTIFLDEIAEMHPVLQAKLLQVLQGGGDFARLGGNRNIAVDVRVLAATNKPLERAVQAGLFREDLFYRLNVVTIHIPPLRERSEDIPVFLEFFLHKYSEVYGKTRAPFSDYAVGRIMEYSWPGNIRELENLVKRYTIVGNEPQIIRELATRKPIVRSEGYEVAPIWGIKQDSAQQGAIATNGNGPDSMEDGDTETPSLFEIGKRAALQAERTVIERTLAQTHWNRRRTSKILRISYKALLNKLKAIDQSNLSGMAGTAREQVSHLINQ